MQRLIANIVAPVDFSDSSIRTVRYAAALARRLGASLHLVHVLDALDDRLYHEARAQLASLASTLKMPKPRLSVEVRRGAVAESITRATVDYGADLVIMATHGRSALSHLLMGSVAERVIRSAACPVLVVRSCGQVHVHLPGAVESEQVA